MSQHYRCVIISHSDICYTVQQVWQHMHAPHDVHWALIKQILRYIRGTPGFGLHLRASASFELVAYTDAD